MRRRAYMHVVRVGARAYMHDVEVEYAEASGFD